MKAAFAIIALFGILASCGEKSHKPSLPERETHGGSLSEGDATPIPTTTPPPRVTPPFPEEFEVSAEGVSVGAKLLSNNRIEVLWLSRSPKVQLVTTLASANLTFITGEKGCDIPDPTLPPLLIHDINEKFDWEAGYFSLSWPKPLLELLNGKAEEMLPDFERPPTVSFAGTQEWKLKTSENAYARKTLPQEEWEGRFLPLVRNNGTGSPTVRLLNGEVCDLVTGRLQIVAPGPHHEEVPLTLVAPWSR